MTPNAVLNTDHAETWPMPSGDSTESPRRGESFKQQSLFPESECPTLTPRRKWVDCGYCNKQFSTWIYKPQTYCSVACRFAHVKAEGKSLKPRKGRMVECPRCGKATYKQTAQIEAGRRYCSRQCAYDVATSVPVIKACEGCQAEMRLSPCRSRQKYCSKRCMGDSVTLRPLDRDHNGRKARLDRSGYVLIWEPDHPNAMHGWVYEHRFVVEQAIGRYLDSSEHCHHINGIKNDNRIENLQVMDGLEHAALSARDYRDSVARKLARLEEYERRFGDLPTVD